MDEPTVGLDPKQITEIRTLIKELGKEHTVILSSHILSEISQICKKVIIINNGKIIAQDTPENLENKVNKSNNLRITIEDDNNNILKIKNEIIEIEEIKLLQENEDKTKTYSIAFKKDTDIRKKLTIALAKKEIVLLEMKKDETTLEDAFMELITDKKEEE